MKRLYAGMLALLLICSYACKKSKDLEITGELALSIDSVLVHDFEDMTISCSYNVGSDTVVKLVEAGVLYGSSAETLDKSNIFIQMGPGRRFTAELINLGKDQDIYYKAYIVVKGNGSSATKRLETKVMTTHTNSLTVAWEKILPWVDNMANVIKVIPTADKGFVILAGLYLNNNYYIRLLKFDADGYTVWATDKMNGNPVDLIQVADGYVVGGSTGILKFDQSGNLSWQQDISYPGSLWDFVRLQAVSNTTFRASIRTNDGSLVTPVNPLLRTLLYNTTGGLIKETAVANAGNFQSGPNEFTIATRPDSSFIISNKYISTTVNAPWDTYQAVVSSFNKDNQVQWEEVFGGKNNSVPTGVGVTSSGNISVVGYIQHPETDSYANSLWLFGVDKNSGNKLWEQVYYKDEWGKSTAVFPTDLYVNSKDEHYISGYLYASNYSKAYLTKFSPNGRFVWEWKFESPYTRPQRIYTSETGDIYIFGVYDYSRILYMAKLNEK